MSEIITLRIIPPSWLKCVTLVVGVISWKPTLKKININKDIQP